MTKEFAHIVNDYGELSRKLGALREHRRVVCTIGSWDILHGGHIQYLESAAKLGDILVVGVDSDESYRRYKNKLPWYQETDRQKIVSSVRFVDFVTIIRDVTKAGEWQYDLIKAISPDVFAFNERAYSEKQRLQIAKLCDVALLAFHEPNSTAPSVEANVRLKGLAVRAEHAKQDMRSVAFYVLLVAFSFSILTTLALVVLQALSYARLPESALMFLIGKTIPELFGMMYLVIKYLFNSRGKQ